MNLKKRWTSLQKLITHPVLISDPLDTRYYTGFAPGVDDHPLLLMKPTGKPILFVSPLSGKIRTPATVKEFSGLSSLRLPKKVGFDGSHLPAGWFLELKKGRRLVDSREKIKKPREVKDAEELAHMQKAIRINKKVLTGIELFGKREEAVAREIEERFRKEGAGRAFETIVSSGGNAGTHIHHFPTSRKIRSSDMVIIDFGSQVEGYASDITRTRIDHRNTRQRMLLETVMDVQQACIDLVEPGVKFSSINNHHKRLLKRKGFTARHGIGHGIGLFVHETASTLEKGMVVTIEPGIYLSGYGGCRLEDMILVTKTGNKVLSRSIPLL